MKDTNFENNQLQILRKQLLTNNRIKDFTISDDLLIKFLRSRDFDVSEALNSLLAYIDIINKRPDLFSWSEEIKKVISSRVYVHQQKYTREGYLVTLVSPGKWNPSDYSYTTYIKLVIFMIEISLLDEGIQKNGNIVIVDMNGIRWTHIYHTGISDARLFCDLTERILPRKVISVHFVNINRLTDAVLKLFRPFMAPSTLKVMHLHGKDHSLLHQSVPPSVLPRSLGGTAEEIQPSTEISLIEKHRDQLIKAWDRLRI